MFQNQQGGNKMKKMKRKHRKILGSLLSMLLLFAMSTTSFAAEPTSPATPVAQTSATAQEAELVEFQTLSQGIVSQKQIGAQQYLVEYKTASGTDTVVLPRSIYGYAADYTDYTNGYFDISVPGSGNSTGATIKSTDFPSGTTIYVSLIGPGNVTIKSNIKLTGNMETYISFSNCSAGTYRLVYSVYGSGQGWLHCWVY